MISLFKTEGRSHSTGFTLIELLVVIAIIGILSSVVLASLNSARLKARDARRVSDLGQLQLALAVYYDAHSNTYPNDLSADLAPTYIAKIPTDPLNGTAYTYVTTGTCAVVAGNASGTGYHLGGSLEDLSSNSLTVDADDAGADTACGGATNFNGLAAAAGGAQCSGAAGTAQTGGGNGTESCYDVNPL